MKRSTIIILSVIGILLIWSIVVKNSLASSEVEIKGMWGKVQTQYNRKAKMYENIVNTIKGAARNEDTTLINIVKMRSRIPVINDQSTPAQLSSADNQLNGIGRAALNVNIEAYPNLQATGLFRDLQAQIEGTENRVTTALGDWNDEITKYNNIIVRFPGSIIASIFGYKTKENYTAPVGSEDTKVDFSK